MAGERKQCVIEPSGHLLKRMEERGFSDKDVENAVYRGSRERVTDKKFKAKYGICEVVVDDSRICHYSVCTAYIP